MQDNLDKLEFVAEDPRRLKKREKDTVHKVRPVLPRGFLDQRGTLVYAQKEMLSKIEQLYQNYGFEALETPFFEYTDVLGKFLPDQDRPNAGVFSLKDEDAQWISLRYDLTAPLARYVAAHLQDLPRPFRSYRSGFVFRNEKPGPGRFRQFMQCDADIVGTDSVLADAEICMLAADSLETVGIPRGQYVIRLNNRKILDGILEPIGFSAASLASDPQLETQRLIILRAIDKLDRLGSSGVAALLGKGRRDESGDFTKGAALSVEAQHRILSFLGARAKTSLETLAQLDALVADSKIGQEGVAELREMHVFFQECGYEENRIVIDPSVVRGLDYYTGPVYEAELLLSQQGKGEDAGEESHSPRFGSVGGGGRYDGLIGRFGKHSLPATGFSIGVSRLLSALQSLRSEEDAPLERAPVVVIVIDRGSVAHYQNLVRRLRTAGIAAEMYSGASGVTAQMKYADRRGAPCVVIQGPEERARGEIQIKDLKRGRQIASQIEDPLLWRTERPAQFRIPEAEMVPAVHDLLRKK